MRKIALTGTENKSYDLDKLEQQGRENPSQPLVLQNWFWHPNAEGDRKNPDPPNVTIGQIWVSVRCSTIKEMNKLIESNGGN